MSQTIAQPLTQATAPINFDIPAQSLIHALDAYSAATGLMVLYDSDLAEGRSSTAVGGVLIPDVAIRVLLEGTGLTVFNTGKAFAIEREAPDQPDPGEREVANLPYFALLQAAMERVFCERIETRPGLYRAALQFRIGTSGEVLSPKLLSSTGDMQRDRTIIELLGGLRIPHAPPPGMTQPVSMIIAPRPTAQSGDCGRAQNSAVGQATR